MNSPWKCLWLNRCNANLYNMAKLYDIVEGPMADDTVWNYVNDFLSGEISRNIFWELAKFKYPTHQISFHTLKALDRLKFERSEIVNE